MKLPNLHMLINQKSSSLSRNLALGIFAKSLKVFSRKLNLLYLFYSTAWTCCLLHLTKQNCFLKTFLRTLILITHVSLYLFSLLDLIWNCIISPKMVKKVIINLDLSKASGPDCIPVVVLKNCELDLCYILTELFNKFLKESCFPDCREVSSVVLVFKNVGKVLQVKTTTLLVFFLWFVKSLKNL